MTIYQALRYTVGPLPDETITHYEHLYFKEKDKAEIYKAEFVEIMKKAQIRGDVWISTVEVTE